MLELSDIFRKWKTMSNGESWTDPSWYRSGGKFHHPLKSYVPWDNGRAPTAGARSVGGWWEWSNQSNALVNFYPTSRRSGLSQVFNSRISSPGKDTFSEVNMEKPWLEFLEIKMEITEAFGSWKWAYKTLRLQMLRYVHRKKGNENIYKRVLNLKKNLV